MRMVWLVIMVFLGGFCRSCPFFLGFHEVVVHHKQVHAATREGIICGGLARDNRLAAQVKGGIEDGRHPRGLFEACDETVVASVKS